MEATNSAEMSPELPRRVLERIAPRWPWLVVAFLLFPLSVAYALKVHAPSDDAYIYLVYVKNLVAGNGLTFNGAVVEGFSSVAWMFLLSAMGLLNIADYSLPLLGQLLSFACGLLALFSTRHLARRAGLEERWALLAVALLAATGDFVFYMSSGLETVLFVALVPLCVAKLYDDDLAATLRSLSFPLLMAVTILARPEGALLCGLVLVCGLLSTRSLWLPVRCGLVLSAMLAPVFVAKRLHYGYWLPNTYYVKGNAGLGNLGQGIDYLEKSLARYDVLLLAVALAGVWALWRRGSGVARAVAPLAFVSAVWLVQVAVQGGDNMVGGRTLIPALPLVYVALALLARELRFSVAAGATALLCLALVARYLGDEEVARHAGSWRKGADIYRAAGKILHERFAPDTLVALNPAGMIPFYSGLPTIDMLGLNDVHIAHRGKRDPMMRFAHQVGDGAYVLSREPGVILFGGFLKREASPYFVSDRQIWSHPGFERNYRPVEWPGVGWAWVRR
jgi:arabinofuranosyltransferase